MEDQINFESRIDFTDLNEKITRIRERMGKVIIGQKEVADLLLTAMLADGHILIEGVPGIAKTLMAKVMARMLDVTFNRIQFTPDLMPSDILGTSVFLPAAGRFEYPFVVVGTQNPIEHEGTYRLPEAQLDRFLFKINVTYPSVAEEIEVLELHDHGAIARWQELEPVLSVEALKKLRAQVAQVRVDPKIKSFIVNIVDATRKSGWLYLGASPRASIALMNGAKAFAAIQGRDFVVPDDVLYLVNPVLRHRVQLSSEKELEGVTVDQVVQQIVSKIEVPR